jgi:type IV pilus assembly protein PilP
MKSRSFALVALLLPLALLVAQTPPPAPGTPPQSAAEPTLEANLEELLEESPAAEAYRYDPQGRRDPFRSLIGPTPQIKRDNVPPGPAGFMIDEMDLQGVVQTRSGLVAMITGPDNNGYLLRVGDKALDGEVIRITGDSLVFRQEVNDPTRIERFREVVKELNPQSGAPR